MELVHAEALIDEQFDRVQALLREIKRLEAENENLRRQLAGNIRKLKVAG